MQPTDSPSPAAGAGAATAATEPSSDIGHAPAAWAPPIVRPMLSQKAVRGPANNAHSPPSPTLFDRLRDDSPAQLVESLADHAISANQMRDIVQRDLTYLLNTTNAEDLIDRVRYPDAASSTVNFGVRPLAGSYLSDRRWPDIERIIRRAIAEYEPRLIAETVMVLPVTRPGAGDDYNVLQFEIRAMIDLKPSPIELIVQSSVDLETNRMSVTRQSGGFTRAPTRFAR